MRTEEINRLSVGLPYHMRYSHQVAHLFVAINSASAKEKATRFCIKDSCYAHTGKTKVELTQAQLLWTGDPV